MKIQDALDLHLKEEASRIIGERNERFRIAESFMESYSTVNSTGGSSVRNAVNRSSWVVAILHTNATRD